MNLLHIILVGLLAVQADCQEKAPHGKFFAPPPDTCSDNTQCPSHQACLNKKCQNPCEGGCGIHARCEVRQHLPYCSCVHGYTGCPVYGCIPEKEIIPECETSETCNEEKACINGVCTDPCSVITCGADRKCEVSQHTASCVSTGTDPPATPAPLPPPLDCSLECSADNQCPPDKACVDQHCADPCLRRCGENATCRVVNHVPSCACLPSYKGNPFEGCTYDPNGGCLGRFASVTGKVKKYTTDITRKVDWIEAHQRCASNGQRLATVMNEQEMLDIKKAIRNTELRGEDFWLGGTDHLHNNEWFWFTTNKWERIGEFTDWRPGQPDLDAEDCLEYTEQNQQVGYKWNNLGCHLKLYYICEYFE